MLPFPLFCPLCSGPARTAVGSDVLWPFRCVPYLLWLVPALAPAPEKSLATTLSPPSPQIFPWEHRQRLLFLAQPYIHRYTCVSVCACVRAIKNSRAVKFSCSF